MKQRDLEALAARYFTAPEADEALIAEEARMCATLPEAWRATLAETAGFHDWHLLELSLRGAAALLRLRADNGTGARTHPVQGRRNGAPGEPSDRAYPGGTAAASCR